MESMKFIHLSDLHYRVKYQESGIESVLATVPHPALMLKKCLEYEIEYKPDFILITGDLVHEGNVEDYQELHKLLKEQAKGIPIIALPGNHDKREAYIRGFLGIEPQEKLDTVYDIKGFRIVVLDTGSTVNGVITKRQTDWLKEVVSQSTEKEIILALHHPLLDSPDGLPRAEYESEFIDIILKSDIRGIFCGHTHHNYASQFANKPYFTADSITYSMRKHQDRMYVENNAAYTIMEWNHGIFSAQVKRVLLDSPETISFSLDKLSQLFKA